MATARRLQLVDGVVGYDVLRWGNATGAGERAVLRFASIAEARSFLARLAPGPWNEGVLRRLVLDDASAGGAALSREQLLERVAAMMTAGRVRVLGAAKRFNTVSLTTREEVVETPPENAQEEVWALSAVLHVPSARSLVASFETTDDPQLAYVVIVTDDEPVHADASVETTDEPVYADTGVETTDEPVYADTGVETSEEQVLAESELDTQDEPALAESTVATEDEPQLAESTVEVRDR